MFFNLGFFFLWFFFWCEARGCLVKARVVGPFLPPVCLASLQGARINRLPPPVSRPAAPAVVERVSKRCLRFFVLRANSPPPCNTASVRLIEFSFAACTRWRTPGMNGEGGSRNFVLFVFPPTFFFYFILFLCDQPRWRPGFPWLAGGMWGCTVANMEAVIPVCCPLVCVL